MATTYKFLHPTNTETLTAQLFADGIEVHSSHALIDCLRYQWFYDDLLGSSPQAIMGATSASYEVPLASVGSSGEYYCQIRIGTTGDCVEQTELRRITIVNPITPRDNIFSDTGASGELVVEAPHYEQVIYSDEGATFISPDDNIIACSTPMGNVCRFVQNFTVAATTNKAEPREAQLTMTVGELVLFFNIGQDRTLAQAPAAISERGPDGPFINLAQNGPATAGSPITVTATVGTVGTAAPPYTVTWPDGSQGLTYQVTRTDPGTMTIMASVSDTNGLRATETIELEWLAQQQPSPTTRTTLTGATFPRVDWNVFQFGNPTVMAGVRMQDAFFSVTGAGRWQYTVYFNQGYFGSSTDVGQVSFVLTGPGVNNTTVVRANQAPVTIELPAGTVGLFRYQLTISGIPDNPIVYPSGSVTLIPINF